jgi:hypothetical protein
VRENNLQRRIPSPPRVNPEQHPKDIKFAWPGSNEVKTRKIKGSQKVSIKGATVQSLSSELTHFVESRQKGETSLTRRAIPEYLGTEEGETETMNLKVSPCRIDRNKTRSEYRDKYPAWETEKVSSTFSGESILSLILGSYNHFDPKSPIPLDLPLMQFPLLNGNLLLDKIWKMLLKR